MSNKATGNMGEGLAEAYLIDLGYQVLARNYRFGAYEVDLITQDPDGVVVFIEVKTSRGTHRAAPEQLAGVAQMKRVSIAAGEFMYEHELEGEIRFDVIGVHLIRDREPDIQHYPDVYYPQA